MVEGDHRPFDIGILEQIMKNHNHQYLVALFASQSVKKGLIGLYFFIVSTRN